MAFTQLTNNLNIIQALDDQPNDVGGLTAAQVKAKFDEAGNTIKVYINDTLIAELEAATAAASLGITAPSGLTGTNIQAVIEDLVSKVLLKTNTTAYTPTADYHPATKKYIDDSLTGVVLGQLPDNLTAHLAETAQAHGDHDSQDVLLIRDAAGKLTGIDIKKPDDTGVSRITATLSFDANGRLSSALEKEFDVDGTTVKSQATTTILRDANGRITELEVR